MASKPRNRKRPAARKRARRGRASKAPSNRRRVRKSLAGTAKGKRRKGRIIKPGRVDVREMTKKLDQRGVVLRGGDLDEAPQVYRRLDDVLTAQGDTIEILHRLRPQIVCMAPADTFDPYRD